MKKCGICNEFLKTGDIVVSLLLARFISKEDGYTLEAMAQTISSHVYCAENKSKPEEVKQ